MWWITPANGAAHAYGLVRFDPDRSVPRRLSIVVEDDGPGIPQELRTRVIERGVRADEHVPGHGLGLAMVRETVRLYGGQFFIDARRRSAGPGWSCGCRGGKSRQRELTRRKVRFRLIRSFTYNGGHAS